MQIHVPFIGEITRTDSFWTAYCNEKETLSGLYPVSLNELWHTGIHLSCGIDEREKQFIKPIITGGKILACRIAEDYKYKSLADIDEIRSYLEKINIYQILLNAKNNYPEAYEKITGNRNEEPLFIRDKLLVPGEYNFSTNAIEALSKIITSYSTTFVLTKHSFTTNVITAQNPQERKIESFILYSNLAPLCDYNAEKELCRCFFRKWTIKESKYSELLNISRSASQGNSEGREMFVLYRNKECNTTDYKNIFLADIRGKKIEILDMEIHRSEINNVKIENDFGYVRLKKPLRRDDIQAEMADPPYKSGDSGDYGNDLGNIKGYIGMQGYSQNQAVHIEVFMP